MNGIPLRGWKTDVHRGEARAAGFNLTGYKTASTWAKLFERESLHPCDPGRKTRSNVSGAGGGWRWHRHCVFFSPKWTPKTLSTSENYYVLSIGDVGRFEAVTYTRQVVSLVYLVSSIWESCWLTGRAWLDPRPLEIYDLGNLLQAVSLCLSDVPKQPPALSYLRFEVLLQGCRWLGKYLWSLHLYYNCFLHF